jgi:starch phosphorylase
MKFALNGALTIGRLDGANLEIREEVGDDNIFIFGLRIEELEQLREMRAHHARGVYAQDARGRRVVESLKSNRFCAENPSLFQWISDALLGDDPYHHLADFGSYLATQERVSEEFKRRDGWTRKAILNVAHMGHFSSDRTIREYVSEIWDPEATTSRA